MKRSGSFPIMNLAEDFGVDYGDVLLIAMGIESEPLQSRRILLTVERQRQVAAAETRVRQTAGRVAAVRLNAALRSCVR